MEFINAVGGVTGNVASPYSLQTAPLGLLENVASSRNVTGEGWGDVWVKVCVLMVVLLLACLHCNCVYSDFITSSCSVAEIFLFNSTISACRARFRPTSTSSISRTTSKRWF